jgi:hypothetical protein
MGVRTVQSRISYFWKEPNARQGFEVGVSLHSHTNHSRESLSFVPLLADRWAPTRWYFEHHKRKALKGNIPVNLFDANWTPPVTAREAYELERKQIEDVLGLQSVVSLSDHDNIEASTLLRVIPEFSDTPIAVEWTVPFEEGYFHLGVHNLPPRRATSIMAELAEYTANPRAQRLKELFRFLNELESVLIVFNHPKWNIALLDPGRFQYLLADFLAKYSAFLHAFELNGLRSCKENQEVAKLANGWNQLVISGGDRHGREPNANVNLTNAHTMEEFIHEARVRRISDVMFMPQYADPLAMRFVHTFLDVIRDYPDYPEGARTWAERTLHPDHSGALKPVSGQWEAPPGLIATVFRLAFYLESGLAPNLWRKVASNKDFRLNLMDGQSNL